MLTLIGTRKSRAFRVLWMLEELGVTYTHDPSPPRSPNVMKTVPSGKIPALVEDDTVIRDSTAILTYLADKHGRFTYPAGSQDRARQDGVTGAILDEMEGALWTASKHMYVLPEAQRLPEILPTARWEFEQAAARLSEAFKGPYLMGDEMTVPDFILVHCLGWAKIAGFPEPGEVLATYSKSSRARDAYKRAAAMA